MIFLDREQALLELSGRVSNKNLIIHSFAVESIMKALGSILDEDVELWSLTGLLHDIDFEKTLLAPEKRGKVGAEILENLGLDETIVYAVKAHNDIHGIDRRRKLDKALYATDPISELIFVYLESIPSKSINDINVKGVMEKFYDNTFAQQIDRSKILECEKIGLSLDRFVEISIDAIKDISDKIKL